MSASSSQRYCVKCKTHMSVKEFKAHYPTCKGKKVKSEKQTQEGEKPVKRVSKKGE